MTVQLKDALKTFFEEKNITSKIEDSNIFLNWESIVGSNIAKVTKVQKIQNNILFIKTKNSVWRTELTFQKECFIDKILQKLPKMKIKDIRFI